MKHYAIDLPEWPCERGRFRVRFIVHTTRPGYGLLVQAAIRMASHVTTLSGGALELRVEPVEPEPTAELPAQLGLPDARAAELPVQLELGGARGRAA
jgi:hypothetical protein